MKKLMDINTKTLNSLKTNASKFYHSHVFVGVFSKIFEKREI